MEKKNSEQKKNTLKNVMMKILEILNFINKTK